MTREDASKNGFVTLSETWPLYGGWKIRAGEREVPIRLADGVVTGVHLKAGEKSFVARYEPRTVRVGLLLGSLGLLIAVLLMLPWPSTRSGNS